MMRRVLLLIVVVMSALALQACTFNRSNVKDLALQQQAYYVELRKTLRAERDLLEMGLQIQVEASTKRRENLAAWALDLRKAEVLLQVDSNVTGNQRMLSYKLAEIDLAAVENAEFSFHEAERAAAYLALYDQLIKATSALEKNNAVLIEYFSTNDEEFALRNLDIDGVVRSIAGIRDIQEKLGNLEERSAEEKKVENERLQRHIERTRDVLLKALQVNES